MSSSFVDVLRRHVEVQPHAVAYTFLDDEGALVEDLTYAELDAAARALAARMQESGDVIGERVLIIEPTGPDFICAFFGALYAGAVAMPIAPLRSASMRSTLGALLRNGRPRFGILGEELHAKLASAGALGPELASLRLLPARADNRSPDDWHPPPICGDSLALLQYTSGSTGAPRGVMVSHGNLLHNEQMMSAVFRTSADSVIVNWLPLFHDMGLIGNMLQSAWLGSRCVLLAPLAFLKHPFRWLEAISRYGADFSGAPNFAYDLCTRKVTAEERLGLDLGRWRVAFNGAEPVRAETLTRFALRFADAGFLPRAFYPCYGLAEATLFVAGGAWNEEPRHVSIVTAELERNRVRLASGVEPAKTFVSCGRASGEQGIAIVDPGDGRRLPEGHVGEVWIAGKSVAAGYFEDRVATSAAFGAHTSDGAGPFLRTGDLAFLHREELFIVGRSKDLVVIRGRNHHPHDLEGTVEGCHPALRPGCGACFSVDNDSEEQLVIVQEVVSPDVDMASLAAAIRSAVFEHHEVQALRIALVASGVVPKTSSGKLQRRACRARLLAGELPVLHDSWLPSRDVAAPGAAGGSSSHERLRRLLSQVLRLAPEAIDEDRPLVALGLDSLSAAELRAHLKPGAGGRDLAFDELLSTASLRSLAEALGEDDDGAHLADLGSLAAPRGSTRPVSATQRRLWLLEQLVPASYNVPFGLEIEGPLDLARLRSALDRLVARHDVLRTSFRRAEGELEARVADRVSLLLPTEDLRDLVPVAREQRMREIGREDAALAFDATQAPLLRARLLRLGEERHLLSIVVHHLIADGWSLGILARELAGHYERPGEDGLPAPQLHEETVRAAATRDPERAERARAYWQERLAGADRTIDLPRQRSRRGGANGGAIRIARRLPIATRRAIEDLACREGVTPFVVVLAAFEALLHRYSGQTDLSLGTVVAERASVRSRSMIGPLINTLVLRLDCSGDPTFRELLGRARKVAAGALEHADLPFDEVIQALGADARGPAPFQVMVVYESFPVATPERGELRWTQIDLDLPLVPFDLTLAVRPTNDALVIAMDADAALFDEDAVGAMLEHYRRGLEAALAAPERRLSHLSPWTEDDGGWWDDARTTAAAAPFVPAHRAFEEAARRTPDAPAILGNETWSYGRLDAAADAIARIVQERVGGPDRLVGIHVDDAGLRLAAVLGVLKAGAAYLPLDVASPTAWSRRIVDDAHPALLLSGSEVDWYPSERLATLTHDLLTEPQRTRGVDVKIAPEQLAYVAYTSGSTGESVGVEILHGGLAQHCHAIAEAFVLSASDRVLQFASPSFDVSAEETFPTWSRGGAVVTIDDRTPRALQRAMLRHGVTMLNLPSRYWELWAAETGGALASLRLLVVGSEAVSATALATFRARFPRIACWHAYGLTEATITSTIYPVADLDERALVPLGRTLPGTTLYVLDDAMERVGRGGRGELYIGGAGLARGYLDRPEMTAKRFVPNPFGGAGERLLRTGDLVRHRWDGELEHIGRRDRQLKVGGHRIEPGEIEQGLRRAGAKDAAVVARGDRLIAYVEAGEQSLETIRQAASAALPRSILPTSWVDMKTWPRAASGKIDHRRLPEPEAHAEAGSAPRGALEEVLAGIYGELLGIEGVKRETSFFEAGGYSLLAMQVVGRIERALAVELPLRAIFESPMVWELAERVTKSRRGEKNVAAEITKRSEVESVPLTAAQRRLWFLEMLHGKTARYNMPLVIVVRGALDEQQLCWAFDRLIERHEALRTVIVGRVARLGPSARLEVERLSSPADARQRAEALAQEPFDIEQGPLMRARLLCCVGDAERLIVLVVHHLISDGRSLQVMLEDLGELYRTGAPKAPPRLQYSDYALREAELGEQGRYQEGIAFWKRQLDGSEPVLLPYDGSVNTGVAGRVKVRLPVTTSELEALSRRAGVTLHMTILGAVQVLLSRYSGHEDVRVAIPLANRGTGELEDIVGCFVNTVVMRTPVKGGEPFLDHLSRVKRTAVDAYEYGDTPFEELVAALQPGRGGGTPLIEVMLLVERDGLKADFGVEADVEELDNAAAKFDLTITVRLRGRVVEADLEYDRGRFERDTAEALLGSLQELIKSIVREPEEPSGALRILSEDAEAQIVAWEQGGPVGGGRALHAYVHEQAARTPDAIAVESGVRTLTYRQLDERSNQVARGLVRLGLGPEALIGVRLRRTEELVVAMLGVLKAGAAYVPIDPEYPAERQKYIAADSGAQHTLKGIGEFGKEDRSALAVDVEPGRLAYVIYTSGSEGRPKGVGITHGGASALLEWAKATYSAEEMRRVLASTSVCFDLSLFEIFGPLAVGGTVVLVENVLEIGETEDVTLVNSVPSAVSKVLDRLPKSVKTVNLAGEALPRSLVDALYERGVGAVWNLYGPTEDTTYSTAVKLDPDDRRAPGIGWPLPGTTAYVLDDRMARAAKGARGELYLGGAGLARGYVNQPTKTAERFIPDPHGAPGEWRLYRTGDWVLRRADGELKYLGRRDGQVKVRGYRIEPAEVEEGLRKAGAREAVVVAQSERLVAYVELGDESLDEVRKTVGDDLPRYLVPTSWVEVHTWPRTASGKIDRARLPQLDEREETGSEPNAGTEAGVAAIFREVLEITRVSRETSFFEAGGHSLLALQVVERLERAFEVELTVRSLFDAPTVRDLAECVDAARGKRDGQAAAIIGKRNGEHDAPLSTAQRRLWFLDQITRESSHYHVPIALTIAGDLDLAALTGAFESIVARHESLRTTFPAVDGVPFQRIAAAVDLRLSVVDLDVEGIDAHIACEVERPFSLTEGPLFRFSVLRARVGEATLLIVMHHIICDEWSLGVLLREFSDLYRAHRGNQPTALPPLALQLADYAEWEAGAAAQARWDLHRRYWETQLRGASPVRLSGAPGAGGLRVPPGRYHAFSMDRVLSEQVEQLALASRATRAMVLLAAFDALLYRYTGDEDLAVGTPVANRRRETEPLIGFFVNQLVLRVDLRGRPTFRELIRRVREVALAAYAHQELPFDEIVAAVRTRETRPLMPLVNVQFDLHNAPFGSLEIDALRLVPRPIARSTVQFDLQLSIEEATDGLHCFLGCNAARFDDAWACRFADDLVSVVTAAVSSPNRPIDELLVVGGRAADDTEDFAF